MYTFFVVDNGNKTGYRVIVDPGNGQVLHTSEGFPLKSLGLMHAGGIGGNWKDHGRGGDVDILKTEGMENDQSNGKIRKVSDS